MPIRLTDRLARFENRSTPFWIGTGCLLVALLGTLDVVIGNEWGFSFFYLIPVMLATWFASRNIGLAISLIASAAWFTADALAGQSYSHPAVRYWNALVRLGFFVVVTLLLPALKALEREKDFARTDPLTGAANRRHVFERLEAELNRSRRYARPLTIAYIDLDGFKSVNDRLGHQAGDRLLRAVVDRAKSHLRNTDLFGRLGGDEFVVLLPEIGPEAAPKTASRILSALHDEMRRHHWRVTFSVGALTYLDGPMTADDLIGRADALMYSVKENGKNAIAYAAYSAATGDARPSGRP